ncbi:MAG: GAF domain-containing protein [Bacteroidales bacterium]|nr:GAF domain-containing protein [Bacteroidales bacterium]
MMNKQNQYLRIYNQLKELLIEASNIHARRATLNALLLNKMKYFSWSGYYIWDNGDLIVHSYQGQLACIKLKKNTGVCWKCYNDKQTVIVPDVDKFDGHIACDPKTRSEIAVPVFDRDHQIIGVYDVDSLIVDAFDNVDAMELENLVELIEKY